MQELHVSRLEPRSGKARSLVIFLHGYGADGRDLLGIGENLAPHLPDTLFLAPDAPEPCRGNPMGYQWFPVPRMDGSSESQMRLALAGSTKILHAWLDKVAAAEGIPAARTVLFGFSQGTMMSLHVGPARANKLAGIAGFSGRLLEADGPAKAMTRPPILLVHGDADPVVPFESLGLAVAALKKAGFAVQSHVSPGVAHGIGPDGLGLALQFIQKALS